jgi:Protein of unknown function (DUF2934)
MMVRTICFATLGPGSIGPHRNNLFSRFEKSGDSFPDRAVRLCRRALQFFCQLAFAMKEAHMAPEREAKIRERAYEIWMAEGCPDGREHEHWEQATRDVDAPDAETAPASANDLPDAETAETRSRKQTRRAA